MIDNIRINIYEALALKAIGFPSGPSAQDLGQMVITLIKEIRGLQSEIRELTQQRDELIRAESEGME